MSNDKNVSEISLDNVILIKFPWKLIKERSEFIKDSKRIKFITW